jgi:hypothetical protein
MDMKAAGALSAYAYQSALAQMGNTGPAPGRGPALSQARAAEPRAPVQVATTAPEQPQRGASLDLLA